MLAQARRVGLVLSFFYPLLLSPLFNYKAEKTTPRRAFGIQTRIVSARY